MTSRLAIKFPTPFEWWSNSLPPGQEKASNARGMPGGDVEASIWLIHKRNAPCSIYQYSNTALRLSGQTSIFRSIEWFHPIWKCSQNLAFARNARKNYLSARLLVLAKFLQLLACSDFFKNSLPCSVSIICILETKTDTGDKVSQLF